jgi:hypothetical protein
MHQHVGAVEPVRMLFAFLIEIECHAFATMLNLARTLAPLASHGS